jgi:hypothetical protein
MVRSVAFCKAKCGDLSRVTGQSVVDAKTGESVQYIQTKLRAIVRPTVDTRDPQKADNSLGYVAFWPPAPGPTQ